MIRILPGLEMHITSQLLYAHFDASRAKQKVLQWIEGKILV